MKVKVSKIMVAFVLIMTTSLSSSYVANAITCYSYWYASSTCTACDDSLFNTTQTDTCSEQHPRQNGIKLCYSHMNSISTHASYYKRGFSDYNCLAYAPGQNGVQTWTWPSLWGSNGPDFNTAKTYFVNRGYEYTTDASEATGTEIVYIYAKNGYIKHFARAYTLDGQKVAGAATISKWGACSLYKTTAIDPYITSNSYGNLVLICYK